MKAILAALLLPLCGFGQYAYTISGKTPDIFNGRTIYLTIFDDYSVNRYLVRDSTIVYGNLFSFHGTLKKPAEMARLSYTENGGTYSKQIAIDTGNFALEVLEVPLNYRFYKNKLSLIASNGSVSNQILFKMDSISNAYYDNYGYFTDSSRQFRVLSLKHERQQFQEMMNLLCKDYGDHYFSLIQLCRLSHFQLAADSILIACSQLSESLRLSPLGKELIAGMTSKIDARNATQPGRQMPVFRVKTFENTIISNQSLVGRPYLVAFSATWCIPCHENLPAVIQLYNKYKASGLRVVYFNLDDNRLAWKKEIEKYHMSWINVSEGVKFQASRIAKTFNIDHIPVYILADGFGKILYNSIYNEGDVFENLENRLDSFKK